MRFNVLNIRRRDIDRDYFNWLQEKVTTDMRLSEANSYTELLHILHSKPFEYINEYDENREKDGINLRWRFVTEGGDESILDTETDCSILEMLVALSYRIEEIMETPYDTKGISYWFWMMLDNLDISDMTNDRIDKEYINNRLTRFINRDYEYNGHDGNIFYIKNCRKDLRDAEIWKQACWYLDSIM